MQNKIIESTLRLFVSGVEIPKEYYSIVYSEDGSNDFVFREPVDDILKKLTSNIEVWESWKSKSLILFQNNHRPKNRSQYR